jgi:iron complex transport system substrate-binding protein
MSGDVRYTGNVLKTVRKCNLRLLLARPPSILLVLCTLMQPRPFFILVLTVLLVPFGFTHARPAEITVVDDLGRTVRLPQPARRIVSLAPSLTETLFALDAGDAVVGVTTYCTFPDAARRTPKVGGMINPSLEAIVALKPDLIVLSMEGNVREDFDRLTALGAAVYVSNPRSLGDIRASIGELGALTGRGDTAAALAQRLAREEADIIRTASGPQVGTLLIVSVHPLIVAGRGTYLNGLLEAAGAVNLAARYPSTYPTLSREAVVSVDPDMLLVTSDAIADISLLFEEFPEWTSLRAAKRGSIHRIDSDLVSRPGPRAVDALLMIARLVRGETP